ncbi:MAG: L,D-transpeptidase family protein [Clostridium sp.]
MTRVIKALFLTTFLSLISAVPVLASSVVPTGPAMEIRMKTEYDGDVNRLKTSKETDKLVLVVGNPTDPAKTTLTYFEKDKNGMMQQVFSVEAVSGMNGISTDKKEGDKKTPQGVYSFTSAFGMKENPGSILPYRKVVDGDNFVDDSNSKYYNRLVNDREVARDWNSAENLIRQAPHYNYALVLNYNPDCIPGKGSAIFLHCPKSSNNTGTSGCISVPEDRAKELVTKVDQNTKIIVVPEAKYLSEY